MFHNPFHTYSPPNYQPNSKPNPDPPTEITAGQKLAAKRAKASHLAPDGAFCYRWRYGKVEQAQWFTDHYGSYWQIGELMPPDVISIN